MMMIAAYHGSWLDRKMLINDTVVTDAGVNYGPSRPQAPTYDRPAVRGQPIAVPAIPLEDLKETTGSFSNDALIGEGSYARVYFGLLKDGRKCAVKKLDSIKQPDHEFLAQVLFCRFLNNS
jgi:hypothetical protein